MITEMVSNPYEWHITGNFIPYSVYALADTTPFTGTNATLAIKSATTIDGHSLKRLEVTSNFPP